MRPFVLQWLVAAGHRRGHRSILIHRSTRRQPLAINRQPSSDGFLPGQRVLLDAHNAYPDRGRYADRIEVALATGLPVAIEQDLAWCRGPDGGALAPRVSHETTCDGRRADARGVFLRPRRADHGVRAGRGTLAGVAAHHAEPRLQDQRARAPRRGVGAARQVPALADDGGEDGRRIGGAAAGRAAAGADRIARRPGADVSRRRPRRRAGCACSAPSHGVVAADDADPAPPRATPATNYRRWWNHPWKVVEREGQRAAGAVDRRTTPRA